MHKIIIFILLSSFAYSVNTDFSYWESKWNRAGDSKTQQENFRNTLNAEIENIPKNKKDIITKFILSRSVKADKFWIFVTGCLIYETYTIMFLAKYLTDFITKLIYNGKWWDKGVKKSLNW